MSTMEDPAKTMILIALSTIDFGMIHLHQQYERRPTLVGKP
jgi:hypothetical protein